MSGTITFPVSGGIARFTLGSIYNIHTDGSGTLKFNVIGTASEFDFTCADEAAARRIADLITSLQAADSSADFVVGENVNYPLPPIPAPNGEFLYYDPLANNWFLKLRGTSMDSTAYINFAGVMRELSSSSPTLLQSFVDKPAYGDLTLQYFDAKGNLLLTTTIEFHYTLNTLVPNPFVAGVDNFVVNGLDFDNAALGTVWIEDFDGNAFDDNSGHCPATFVSQFQLSCPAADWNPGDGVTTSPLYAYYRDSGGKLSNVLYVSSIT